MDLQTKILSKFGIDRILHLAYGGWFSAFFHEWYWILLAGLAIGIFKDLIVDKLIRKTQCDWIDILFTFAGSVITLIIKLIINETLTTV